jgi:tetratricopeptide (TPR) repeat protein
MGRLLLVVLTTIAISAMAQDSSAPASSSGSNSASSKQSASAPAQRPNPDLAPPSSDRVPAGALPSGESSSKDDDIDLSPPTDDAKAHPNSSSAVGRVEDGLYGNGVNETYPWNPHKAAKDIEVADFYFKQQNYRGAESRYREALLYKPNDAVATYGLAECLDKLDRPDEAREAYESYLKILPSGRDAKHAKKALERLKNEAEKVNSAK